MSRAIHLIVLHCSASPNERTLFDGHLDGPGFRTPDMVIDGWHAVRGFQRSSYWRGRQSAHLKAFGYHFLIGRNGALYNGRHLDEVGAHVSGWNARSIGVCLVGTDQFTALQYTCLQGLLESLAKIYPDIPLAPPVFGRHKGYVATPGVCGHRDIPGVAKSCPGFDVAKWLRDFLPAGMPALR